MHQMIRPHTRAPTASAAIQAPIQSEVTVFPPSVTAGGSQPVEASPRRLPLAQPLRAATDSAPMSAPAPSRRRLRRGDERSCWRTAAPFVWRRSRTSQTLLHHLRSSQSGPGYRLGGARPPSDLPAAGLLDAARGPLQPAAGQNLEAAVGPGLAEPARLNAPGRRARAMLDQAREVLATG